MTTTCATCAGHGEVPWGGEVMPLIACPSCAGKGWKATPAPRGAGDPHPQGAGDVVAEMDAEITAAALETRHRLVVAASDRFMAERDAARIEIQRLEGVLESTRADRDMFALLAAAPAPTEAEVPDEDCPDWPDPCTCDDGWTHNGHPAPAPTEAGEGRYGAVTSRGPSVDYTGRGA